MTGLPPSCAGGWFARRATIESIDPDGLASFCREKLASFKVPAHWEVRAEPLPRNAAGKILKNVLAGEAENRLVEE